MKLYSSSFLLILLLVLSVNASVVDKIKDLIGLSSDKDLSPIYEKNSVRNIKYGGSSAGYLDVYYDENNIKNLKPVIIFLHGGAWITGTKDDYALTGNYFQNEGYVVVHPNYVLFPKGNMEEMVNDVYQAIQWTFKNVKHFGGNNKKITLVGYSAGAHLMALTTLKSALRMENLEKNLEPLPKVEKLVLFNCPFDFNDYDAIFQIFGEADTRKIENGFLKSVASYLFNSNDIGPTDILQGLENNANKDFGFQKINVFHGGKDKIIPSYSAENFINNINRVSPKIKVNDIYQPSYGHKTLIYGALGNHEEMKQLFLDIIQM
ncbi:hypothetical protein PIROE2DRAFT_12443 [Piromyces sp. E2]|nr:hypothetical protein PIROE2DRAFT_12443 [Piromyces sp. E2]|eukprot:OUM61530.1 hypothetical protein PIROE2DRAFT_12443 [Piromyces sp. E2]